MAYMAIEWEKRVQMMNFQWENTWEDLFWMDVSMGK